MQTYESVCRYRKMSSVEFAEEVLGVKLLWYQKLIMRALDARDKFEKRCLPYKYWFRYYR